MTYYFLINPKGKIMSYGLEPNGELGDNFIVKKEIRDEDLHKITENWIINYRNGNIIFEKPRYVIEQERLQNIENLKLKVQSAKTLQELKGFMADLLTQI